MAVLDTTQVASVSTTIGAALETAGHFMQSTFIDLLGNGLAVSLGTLFYLVSIITALTIVASGGQYKFTRWFLVGPIFFYAACFVRVDSCGVVVRRGEIVSDPDVVWDATQGLVNEELCAEHPARVSYVFKMWNNLASVTINSFVKLLRLEHRGSDFDFISKADRYFGFLDHQITDPITKEFLSLVVQNPCSDVYRTMLALMDDSVSDAQKIILNSQLENLTANIRVPLKSHPQLYKIIKERVSTSTPISEDAILDCRQLWGVAIDVLNNYSVEILAGMTDTSLTDDPQLRAKQVFDKFQNKYAISFNKETNDIEFDKESASLSVLRIINDKSVRLFLDNLKQLGPALKPGDFNQTAAMSLAGNYVGGDEDLGKAISVYSSKQEFRGKGDFFKMMIGLPYVQGILLYFLALSYPFFCLYLIIPGRHLTFFYWFALWVWVKSWDFGFAVVMLIDELLYTLMPHGDFVDATMASDPIQALKTAMDVDPTYSAHIYYNIVAACLAAVPAITAMATNAGGGALLGAVDNALNSFSGDVGGGLTAHSGSTKAQTQVNMGTSAARNAVADASYRIGQSVAPALQVAAMMKAGVGIAQGDALKILEQNKSKADKAGDADRSKYFEDAYSETKNWIAGGAGAFAAKMAEIDSDHKLRTNLALVSYEFQMAAYRASFSPEMRERAGFTRLLGFNAHPIGMTVPATQHMKVMEEASYYPWSDAMIAGMQTTYDKPWFLQFLKSTQGFDGVNKE